MEQCPEFQVGTRVKVLDYRRIHVGLIGRIRQRTAALRDSESSLAFIVDFEGDGNGSGVFLPREIELSPEQ